MTQRPDDPNPFDPFGTMRSMRDANMEAWAKMMQQFVSTDEYTRATGAMLDAYLTTSAPFRKALEQAMTQALQQFNMPTRSDVISIAERLTNLEMRLDDLDAQLSALQRGGGGTQEAPASTGDMSHARGTAAAASMDPVVETISETGGRQQRSGRSRKAANPAAEQGSSADESAATEQQNQQAEEQQ